MYYIVKSKIQCFVVWGGGRVKVTLHPVLNSVSNICNFIKHPSTFQYQDPFNLIDVSLFFLTKSAFFGKNSTFTQRSSIRAVLQIFQFCFSVCMMKDYNYRLGVQHPDYSKLAINQKNGNNITTCRHEIIVQFFSTLTFPSLVTGPSFILISLLVLN